MISDPPERDWERERERDRDSERDRSSDIRRDYYDRPTAISLFLRLGYDITRNEDVLRLADDLRWASERRKADSQQKPHRLAMIASIVIAIIGAALTALGQWVIARLTGKVG